MQHKILLMLVLALSPLVLQLFILPHCNAFSDPDNSRPHSDRYPAHNRYQDEEGDDKDTSYHHYHHETFEQCLSAITGKHSSPLLLFPDSSLYDDNIKVFNPRFEHKPAAVLFAESTAQVSAAVKCAARYGVRVSPSAGRQSFIGASIQDGYLIIDVTRINSVWLSADTRRLSVGAGTSVGLLQSAILRFQKQLDLPGLMGPTLGSCSWVGVAGFTLGGGFGWLGRYLGLGCDSLLEVKAVLADGSIVTANEDKHTDLLWASCGGGGGTFAVVTRMVLKTHTLPNNGRVTLLTLRSEASEEATAQALLDFQAVLPTLDHRLGLDGQSVGSGAAGPQFSIVGVFLGSQSEAESVLEAAGLLKYVVKIVEKDSMYDAVLEQLAPMYTALPPFQYTGPSPWQPPASAWNASEEQVAYLDGLMHGRPVSIVGGYEYFAGAEGGWWYSQSRLLGLMKRRTIQALVEYFSRAKAACDASKQHKEEEGSWYCYMAANGHMMGGEYAVSEPDATAFVHRDKYWLTATQFILPPGQSEFVKQGAVAAAEEFASILDADSEDTPPQVYVNYQVPETTPDLIWQRGYFASNWPRLLHIKTKYDPDGLFSKPQTVTPLPAGGRTYR